MINNNDTSILLLKDQIIDEVLLCLRIYEPIIDAVYQIGSNSYGEFLPSWSDIDFLVFLPARNMKCLENINQLIRDVNQKYRGRLAGSGDSVIDIGIVFKDETASLVQSEYMYFDNSAVIRALFETRQHGKLLSGNNQSKWIEATLRFISPNSLIRAFVHSTLERIQLYHDVADNAEICDLGTLEKYAPHQKYKVIPMLYISICRAVLFVQQHLFVTKKDAFQQYQSFFTDFLEEFRSAFQLRNDWMPKKQTKELAVLAEKLPKVIQWFLGKVNDPVGLQSMIFLRGRKRWHYRGEEHQRIKTFLKGFRLDSFLDELDQYLSLQDGYEITFAQTTSEIVGFVGYRMLPDEKLLQITHLYALNDSIQSVLLNYVSRRGMEKNILYLENTITISPKDF
ncbi:hypothetical protein [Paenibacillus sp. P32E]|uniref:hypothetical protein n=1 Tax=Paenibacillus sp. P32E TaxID=1349434 RepID=UPI00093B19C9|nr:hypothetical protein [Paenibacillus sp. P32E]OKP89117.1 hypothetical protein A3848_16575 [Paenibacillus sp. P32E]